MIQRVTGSDVSDLITQATDISISLLMPTHRSGSGVRQDPIRLKNLLNEATEHLSNRGITGGRAERFLEPVARLVADEQFWRNQGEGLAIYQTDKMCTCFQLTSAVEPLAYVADHFYVKPVVLQQSGSGTFWLLALTWDTAQLYRVDLGTIEPVENAHFPAGRAQLVGERDTEEQLQHQSFRMPTQGRGELGAATFHGHGEGEGKIEADREHYLARVGDFLNDLESVDDKRIVLAATDEVAGHFHSAANVNPVAHIHTSPAHLQMTELHAKAIPLLRERVEKEDSGWDERFNDAAAHQLATTDIEQVLRAATAGAVDQLCVDPDRRVWGWVDPSTGDVEVHRTPSAESIELTNMATLKAVETSARVIGRSESQLPDGSPLAAILRFPVPLR